MAYYFIPFNGTIRGGGFREGDVGGNHYYSKAIIEFCVCIVVLSRTYWAALASVVASVVLASVAVAAAAEDVEGEVAPWELNFSP